MNKLSLYQEVYYLMMIKCFQWFLHKNNIKGKDIFNALSEYEVKRRGDMEEDPTFKQLISYCLLENEKGEILVYERLSGGGEEITRSIFYWCRRSHE